MKTLTKPQTTAIKKEEPSQKYKGLGRDSRQSHYAILIWDYADNPKDWEL